MSGERPPLEGFAAALAGLPAMGPSRIAALLDTWPADDAWARVVEGRAMRHERVESTCGPRPARIASEWRRAARATDVAEHWSRYAAHGVGLGYWFSWFAGTVPGHYSVLSPVMSRIINPGALGAASTVVVP